MSNDAAAARLAHARAQISRAAGELALARSRYLNARDAAAARAAYYAALDALAHATAELERARLDATLEGAPAGVRASG